MNSKKIAFVILHYLAIEETLNCIQSIQKNVNYDNYNIIIVDNGSLEKKDSEKLKKLDLRYESIVYIRSEKNLGFANGNNLGFCYAKNVLKADFIILLNNDTRIEQKDFCPILINKYEEYHYAVAGPLVILKDGSTDSNPMPAGKYILNRQRLARCKMILSYLLSFIGLDEKIMNLGKKSNKKSISRCNGNILKLNDQINIKLHGCALIFAKPYIDKYDGLNTNTFLYLEEDILFVRLRNNKMISLYTPELKIFHDEDAATNKVVQSPLKKRRFIYKNHIKSYKALIKEIKNQ